MLPCDPRNVMKPQVRSDRALRRNDYKCSHKAGLVCKPLGGKAVGIALGKLPILTMMPQGLRSVRRDGSSPGVPVKNGQLFPEGARRIGCL